MISIQESVGYDNPVFVGIEEAAAPQFENAVVVVSTAPATDNEDDMDKNNAGFDRLPGEENKVGLFLFKIRENLVSFVTKRKV